MSAENVYLFSLKNYKPISKEQIVPEFLRFNQTTHENKKQSRICQ